MKHLLIILFVGFTVTSFAQQEIKLEEVRNHIGDSVKLMAKIYGGKYFETANNAPTLLDVGAQYPHSPLTLVIYGEVRKQFTNVPETFYTGKNEWITGKIELYKNKPQIVIHNMNQIVDVTSAPVSK
ncbi:MAG TPA: hypothetical protein VLM16_05990 [Ginsengibacter sp.]|nr:hypothetical protein [Ginsengibacter sp.]